MAVDILVCSIMLDEQALMMVYILLAAYIETFSETPESNWQKHYFLTQ